MKILFVNCFKYSMERMEKIINVSNEDQEFVAEIMNIRSWPLGLMSIKAYINKLYPDTEMKIIDLNLAYLNQFINIQDDVFSIKNNPVEFGTCFLEETLVDALASFKPDVVGLSLLFDMGYYNLIRSAQIVKEVCPQALTIAGGHVPHNQYRTLFHDCAAVDAVSYGEGEIPWSLFVSGGGNEGIS